jgi:hypothetical protein
VFTAFAAIAPFSFATLNYRVFNFLIGGNPQAPPARESRLKTSSDVDFSLCVSVSTPAALEINCDWSLQSTSPLCPQRHEMSCTKKTIS